jgi:hypothetical protein
MPNRMQRKRTKGWRMPANCVYVGRPSKWGNPFRDTCSPAEAQTRFRWMLEGRWADLRSRIGAPPAGPAWHQLLLDWQLRRGWMRRHREELRGKDLCCWCPPAVPCHGDVLLRWANT